MTCSDSFVDGAVTSGSVRFDRSDSDAWGGIVVCCSWTESDTEDVTGYGKKLTDSFDISAWSFTAATSAAIPEHSGPLDATDAIDSTRSAQQSMWPAFDSTIDSDCTDWPAA